MFLAYMSEILSYNRRHALKQIHVKENAEKNPDPMYKIGLLPNGWTRLSLLFIKRRPTKDNI